MRFQGRAASDPSDAPRQKNGGRRGARTDDGRHGREQGGRPRWLAPPDLGGVGAAGSGRQASSAALRLFPRRRNEGVRIALWDFG